MADDDDDDTKDREESGRECKPGETVKFSCNACSVEFEVCYEPKCRANKKEAAKIAAEECRFCPFCSGEDLEAC